MARSLSRDESETFFERKKGYFYGWNKMIYELGPKKEAYELTHFIHRYAFRESFINNSASFSYWVLRDQDTLFSIADLLYESVYRFWIIVMFNNITDPIFSMPMKTEQLFKFCQRKYGVDKVHALHHYEAGQSAMINALPKGTIVSSTYPYTKESISNYEYEERENHKRRYIKLMRPEFLQQVLSEKEDIIKSDFIHMNRKLINIQATA